MSDAAGLTLDLRDDGVAVVTLDQPGASQNTLRAESADAFEAVLDEALAKGAKALVLISGKPDTFIAGADVTMLEAVETAADAEAISRRGHVAFDRLESSKIPVVAAIHGACLGGGLELALACNARVCSDDPATVLGLPEVQLGLLPGGGGTWRLPQLVGIANALDLMLTGRRLRASKAKRMGIVDEVVPQPILLDVAIQHALAMAGDALSKDRSKTKGLRIDADELQALALEKNPIGRRVLFDQARKKLLSKSLGNYPAPERILDVVATGAAEGRAAGLAAEARAFGELVVSPEAASLMHIFFSMTALKKDTGVDDENIEPRAVRQVGMIGAGLMGAGITYVTVQNADIDVRLRDRDAEGLARGMKTVQGLLDKRVRRKRMSRPEADRLRNRVTTTTTERGFGRCDVVIEEVFEDLDLKHRILADIEASTPDSTIFASNTSSIPIGRIAAAAKRPQNVIGMHYFSPVEKMPLLEIVVTPQTDPEVVATCVALGKKQGKTVIVVQDGPGFYTSRILAPYLNEAAWAIAEGIPIDGLDRALQQWGYPVGPITLLDEVGLDVAAKVGPILVDAFGLRMEPPGTSDQLIADGRLGRKNGRGFYRYDGSKKKGAPKEVDTSVYAALGITPVSAFDTTAVAERCALMMVNEAVMCLDEGIIRSPRDGDIGAIFGLGFPPFRGGPFRYVDRMRPDRIVARLEALAAVHGPRFTPAERLVAMARDDARFYP